jgi:hypothetical protein
MPRGFILIQSLLHNYPSIVTYSKRRITGCFQAALKPCYKWTLSGLTAADTLQHGFNTAQNSGKGMKGI